MRLDEFEMPPAGPLCNRSETSTGASANLAGASFGFRATGDAAWDSESGDFAMFTRAGDRKVAAMARRARLMTLAEPECAVLGWLRREKARIKRDPWPHRAHVLHRRRHFLGFIRGHDEVTDTMVRETIAYALDDAWRAAYGHRFNEWLGEPPRPITVNLPFPAGGDDD